MEAGRWPLIHRQETMSLLADLKITLVSGCGPLTKAGN
jgi:hypothetical protein